MIFFLNGAERPILQVNEVARVLQHSISMQLIAMYCTALQVLLFLLPAKLVLSQPMKGPTYSWCTSKSKEN